MSQKSGLSRFDGADKTNYVWLAEELRTHQNDSFLIIALHHPLLTGQDSPHQVRKAESALLQKIQDHSDRNPKQRIIVLSGHNHFFEHYLYKSRNETKIDFLVTGEGGASLKQAGKPDSLVVQNSSFSRTSVFSKYHYVLITLGKGKEPKFEIFYYEEPSLHPKMNGANVNGRRIMVVSSYRGFSSVM